MKTNMNRLWRRDRLIAFLTIVSAVIFLANGCGESPDYSPTPVPITGEWKVDIPTGDSPAMLSIEAEDKLASLAYMCRPPENSSLIALQWDDLFDSVEAASVAGFPSEKGEVVRARFSWNEELQYDQDLILSVFKSSESGVAWGFAMPTNVKRHLSKFGHYRSGIRLRVSILNNGETVDTASFPISGYNDAAKKLASKCPSILWGDWYLREANETGSAGLSIFAEDMNASLEFSCWPLEGRSTNAIIWGDLYRSLGSARAAGFPVKEGEIVKARFSWGISHYDLDLILELFFGEYGKGTIAVMDMTPESAEDIDRLLSQAHYRRASITILNGEDVVDTATFYISSGYPKLKAKFTSECASILEKHLEP